MITADLPETCATCGLHAAEDFLYVVNGCKILRCRYCGVGRGVPIQAFDPSKYYTASYFNGGHDDGYSSYVENANVRRREFATTLAYLKRFAPDGGRLLEIGCAYGFFLEQARLHYDCQGLELAEDAVRSCHERGLTQVVHGAANPESIASFGSLDVVVMLDVIEHLTQPVELLRAISRILRPNGVLLLTTGDYAAPFARLTGKRWRLLTPPQHLWFFTPASIKAVACSAGFSDTLIEHPAKWVPVSMAVRKVGKLIGKEWNAEGVLSRVGIPVNLGDAMRVVLRK